MTDRIQRRVISAGIVAVMYGVDARTVVRWDKLGKLKPDFRTPGGSRRYYLDRIERLIEGEAK